MGKQAHQEHLNKHATALIPLMEITWHTRHVYTAEKHNFYYMSYHANRQKQEHTCSLSESVVDSYPRSVL